MLRLRAYFGLTVVLTAALRFPPRVSLNFVTPQCLFDVCLIVLFNVLNRHCEQPSQMTTCLLSNLDPLPHSL